jgi:putative tryptophan/tyrosine transport system substrate-binding protein
VFQSDFVVGQGALASHGPDIGALFAHTAVCIDKIFKGADSAELPVEQPTRFALKLNLKSARQLGLIIPATPLARGNKAIE